MLMSDIDELRERITELVKDSAGIEGVNLTALCMIRLPEAQAFKIEINSSEDTYADVLLTLCAGVAQVVKHASKPTETYFAFIRMLMHLLEDLAKEVISETRVRKWVRESRPSIDFEELFGEGPGIGG